RWFRLHGESEGISPRYIGRPGLPPSSIRANTERFPLMRRQHRGSTWGGSTTSNACVELRRYHFTPVREAHLLLSSEAPSTPELNSISANGASCKWHWLAARST